MINETLTLDLDSPEWAGPATISAAQVGADSFRVWISWDGARWGGRCFTVDSAEDAIDCALSCAMPWDY
jgi:hypothetical protein